MTGVAERVKLTYEERAKWGKCPVCEAEPGKYCDGEIGWSLGKNIHGETPEGGAHLGRLNAAPSVRVIKYE